MRRPLLALHLHPQPFSIRSQLDPAILIGAQQRVALHRLQRLWAGQSFPISESHAQQDQLRSQVGDPFGRIGRGGTVIAEQHGVDRADPEIAGSMRIPMNQVKRGN